MKIVTLALSFLCCLLIGVEAVGEENKMLAPGNTKDKQELIIQLSLLMGKEIDPKDTKALQAAEAFLVTDAAKAYAFTKVHGVPLEFCPNDQSLIEAMNKYQDSAKEIIALGKIYYDAGIDLVVGEKRIQQSSSALNKGLDEMLNGIRQELKESDEKALEKKCNEATKALAALAQVYGG